MTKQKQDKINFIKEWYTFKDNICKKYNDICTECPLYESSDGWWDEESGGYKYVHNCKFEFEDAYVEEIIELMENN